MFDPDIKTRKAPSGGTLGLCALASGSRGNAIYVTDGETNLLFDSGLSGKEIQRRMALRGIDPADLTAIVVSHEHRDHVHGVGVMARRFHVPAYFTRATLDAAAHIVGKLPEARFFSCGQTFEVGGLLIHPFPISHDAADPVGFTVSKDQAKVGIATDLGMATAPVHHHLQGCQALLLEANHDPQMLFEGPYPWHIKQRVKGRTGHMCNADAAHLLSGLLHAELSHVILGHLSQTNNHPDIALAVVGQALTGHSARLTAARQATCSEMIFVG